MSSKAIPLSIATATAMAGRHPELATLHDRFEWAAKGHLNIAVAIGEPGIGKTRLLAEAAAQAIRDGATVLRGSATEIEGMPPYLPFLEALSPYIRTAPIEQLHSQVRGAVSVLSGILPEIEARLGPPAADYPLPPEQARLRLYESVGAFLARIAAEAPLMLIFDDLQWADPGTLDLLCHVATHEPTSRILVLGAYREGEAASNAALTRALDHLNRHRLLTMLELAPLSEEDVGALAASCLVGAVAPAVSAALCRHSEGNPFFAEELLRSWLESGGLVRMGETWILAQGFDPGRVPRGLAAAVNRRVAHLSSDVAAHLQAASIIGRTFDVHVLADVEGQPVDQVEASLLAASRARLLRTDHAGTFVFSHDKIRECLYAQVSGSQRRRLHEAIGRVLEARPDRESAHQLAALAFHFGRSGDAEQGVLYSCRAAERALENHAADDAGALYQGALDLLPANDRRRGEVLLGLGRAALLGDALPRAASAFEAAAAAGAQRGDRLTAARATFGLAQAQLGLRSWRTARALLEKAAALLEGHRGRELVQVLAQLAGTEAIMGRYAEGIAHARRALESAGRLGQPLLEAQAGRALGKLLTRDCESVPAGRQVLERALACATIADDPAEAAACYFRIAYTTMNTGELGRSREVTLTRIELARRCHDSYQLRHAQCWLAYLAALQGHWHEVEQLVADVQPAAERLAGREPLTFLLKAAGFSAYHRGDYKTAEHAFEAVAAIFKQSPEAIGLYQGILGLVQLAQGRRREARAYMREQGARLAALPPGSVPAGPILTCLSSMALAMDDLPGARGFYAQLLTFSGQYYWFLVDRILAAIEMAQGQWALAQAHLAAAEDLARRESMGPELPLILLARADLELAQGGRGSALRARMLLGEALRTFDALEMRPDAAGVRLRLRDLPPQPGEPVRPPNPAGLSRREVEVLGLVAAGLSNREIADKLTLSEHTVANHLTSIFNKTGSDNRAAATAFAVRHGLA